jgi:hypothetical protein
MNIKLCMIVGLNIPTNYVWSIVYKSAVINTVTVQAFEIMSVRFNIDRICDDDDDDDYNL